MEGRNRQDRGEPARCPLRRYFAVRFDCALRMFVTVAIVCALSWAGIGWIRPGMSDTAAQGTFLLVLAAGLAGPLVEPVLLHWFGTTPGKALFGLAVRCADGSKPTLEQARDRTWTRVWKWWRANSWWGGAPEMRRIWEEAQDGTPNDWQIPGEVYTQKDESVWRCAACGAGIALMLGLSVLWLGDTASLPRQRGALTGAQLAANYNGGDGTAGSVEGNDWWRLEPDGSWTLKDGYRLTQDGMEYRGPGGTITIYSFPLEAAPPSPLAMTETGGVLTAVSWQAEGEGMLDYYRQLSVARDLAWSFAGAQKGLHFWDLRALEALDRWTLYDSAQSFSLGGVTLRAEVKILDSAQAAYGEEAQRYRFTFRMEKTK